MRILVQRASGASIKIEGVDSGGIGAGLVVLLGITHTDDRHDVDFLVDKCVNLRIFEDENGKMNRSLIDVDGELLIVSQFTLYGDASRGRRPGFTAAAPPEVAIPLYELFVEECRKRAKKVVTGRFGADMRINLTNDGPVTLMVESRK